MKILLWNDTIYEKKFESWDSLQEQYVDDETAAGREVPRYEWITLLTLLGGWLLRKTGDEAWTYVKNRRAAGSDDKRYRELDSKLDQIASTLERQSTIREPIIQRLANAAQESGIPFSVVLETDTERELRPGIQKILGPEHIAQDE